MAFSLLIINTCAVKSRNYQFVIQLLELQTMNIDGKRRGGNIKNEIVPAGV
jgi:hypothetical protein